MEFRGFAELTVLPAAKYNVPSEEFSGHSGGSEALIKHIHTHVWGPEEKGDGPIFTAVSKGQHLLVDELLLQSNNVAGAVSAVGWRGLQLIHWAAIRGHQPTAAI